MSTSYIQEGENFVCPLCNIDNRAAAKFCRRCGVSRTVLSNQVKAHVQVIKPPSSSSLDLEKVVTLKPLEAVKPVKPAPDLDVDPEVYTHPNCPSCDTLVRSSDRFCCWCGEVQPNRPLPLLKSCPQCSQSLPSRANYCFVCGRDVGANERLRMRIPTDLFHEESSEFFPTFDA